MGILLSRCRSVVCRTSYRRCVQRFQRRHLQHFVYLTPPFHYDSGTQNKSTRNGAYTMICSTRGCLRFGITSFILCLAATLWAADDDGFKSIFDGKTLNGWKAADMSYWSV